MWSPVADLLSFFFFFFFVFPVGCEVAWPGKAGHFRLNRFDFRAQSRHHTNLIKSHLVTPSKCGVGSQILRTTTNFFLGGWGGVWSWVLHINGALHTQWTEGWEDTPISAKMTETRICADRFIRWVKASLKWLLKID